jgi:hypothetical protein
MATTTYEVHPMKLVAVNRSTFITYNQQFRIQHMSFKGGKSAWIVSKNRGNGWFFAVDHAPTYDEAVAKMKAVA